MTTSQIVLIAVGVSCVATSIVFIVKKIGDSGKNEITLFGQTRFSLTGSALVFFVVGSTLVYLGASLNAKGGPEPGVDSRIHEKSEKAGEPDSPSKEPNENGEIHGVIKSPSGAGLPNVSVVIINEAAHFERTSVTNGGSYAVASIPFGTYEIRVRQPGFKAAVLGIEVLKSKPSVTADVVLAEFTDEDVRSYFAAIEKGQAKLVKDYIDQGMPVDKRIREGEGNTALAEAAPHGKEDVVKVLLEAGADPNTRINSGAVPLIDAAFWGNTPVVRLLLKYRANPNAKKQDGSGITALMFACIREHDDVVSLLVAEPGLNPNDTSNSGQTALGFARDLQDSPRKDRILKLLSSVGVH